MIDTTDTPLIDAQPLLDATSGQRLHFAVLEPDDWHLAQQRLSGEYVAVMVNDPRGWALSFVVLIATQKQRRMRMEELTPEASACKLRLWLNVRRERELEASEGWGALLGLGVGG